SDAQQTVRAETDAAGRFILQGLGAGRLSIKIDRDTVPDGYLLDEIKPLSLQMRPGVPSRVEFSIRAMRTLSGEATYYNAAEGRYAPLVHTFVAIPALQRKTLTDGTGKFSFADLPSGNYMIALSGPHLSMQRMISLPSGPANLKEDFRIANPTGAGEPH